MIDQILVDWFHIVHDSKVEPLASDDPHLVRDVIGRSCVGLRQNINTHSMSCGQNEHNFLDTWKAKNMQVIYSPCGCQKVLQPPRGLKFC